MATAIKPWRPEWDRLNLKILNRSSEEGFSNNRRVKLKTPGFDPQLEGNYTSNCTICFQGPFAILRPLQATRSHALARRQQA